MNDKIRLREIINLIDNGKIVIDIGTDHGLVPLYLAENHITDQIIATDISAPSLQKLRDRLDDDLSKVISTKVTDGFDGLEIKENQIAVIAGMGGNTIVDIIDKNLEFAKSLDYLILASNVTTERLRIYLIGNGFKIERDFLSYENGKYYDILKVVHEMGQELDLSEIYYGFENIENHSSLLEEKLEIDLAKNEQFRENIIKFSQDKEGLDKIEERLEAISEVYKKWKLEI